MTIENKKLVAKLTAIVRRKELDKLKNRGKINED